MVAGFIFNGVSAGPNDAQNMLILDLPCPLGCKQSSFKKFKEQLLDCNMHLDVELSKWILTYSFKKPTIESCADIRHKGVRFEYSTKCEDKEKKDTFLTDRILLDLKGVFKLYQHALTVDGNLKGKLSVERPYLLCFIILDSLFFRNFSTFLTHEISVRFNFSLNFQWCLKICMTTITSIK